MREFGKDKAGGGVVQNPASVAGVIYGLPLRGRRETEVRKDGRKEGRGIF